MYFKSKHLRKLKIDNLSIKNQISENTSSLTDESNKDQELNIR